MGARADRAGGKAMSMSRKLAAELLGTLLFVFIGVGAAVIGHAGTAATALAFGLGLAAASYAFAPVSGGHFNPALTLGHFAAGTFPGRDVIPYMTAQVAGAIVGATLVFGVAHGVAGFDPVSGFAATGYRAHSPGHYGALAVFLCEGAATLLFVLAMLGESGALAMGIAFAALYLVALPVDGGGLNPARATASALYQGNWALDELWAFWVLPLLGGALAGLVRRWFDGK